MRLLLAGLIAALGAALVAPGALSDTPLRLDLIAFGVPLDSGTVHSQFWTRDMYKLHGAVPNSTYQVGLYWWVGNTACFGPPTQSLTTVTLTTDANGDANEHFSYSTPVPAPLLGQTSGIEWIFSHVSDGRIAYATQCATLTLPSP